MKSQLIEEIIFKNRNKAYGAYNLRKRYNRHLFVSLILALLFFVVVVLFAFISSTDFDEEFYDFNNVVFEYSDLNYAPDDPPELPDKVKQPEKDIIPSKTENLSDIDLVNDSVAASDTNQIKDNSLVEGDSLNGNSSGGNGSDTGIVFTRVQEVPMYPGGEDARKKFIKEHFNYSSIGTNVKVEGVVWISFIVEKDGSLTSIKVLNGIGAACDSEVIKVVKEMPKWIPGKRNGLPVRVILKMPIRFENAV